MTTFTPPVGISFSSSVTKLYRNLRNDFGDGYSQITGDGINSVREVWNLSWDTLTDAQADTIEAFLDAQGGIPFNWETPRGETKRFSSNVPVRTFQSYNKNSLTVVFTEEPGV